MYFCCKRRVPFILTQIRVELKFDENVCNKTEKPTHIFWPLKNLLWKKKNELFPGTLDLLVRIVRKNWAIKFVQGILKKLKYSFEICKKKCAFFILFVEIFILMKRVPQVFHLGSQIMAWKSLLLFLLNLPNIKLFEIFKNNIFQ